MQVCFSLKGTFAKSSAVPATPLTRPRAIARGRPLPAFAGRGTFHLSRLWSGRGRRGRTPEPGEGWVGVIAEITGTRQGGDAPAGDGGARPRLRAARSAQEEAEAARLGGELQAATLGEAEAVDLGHGAGELAAAQGLLQDPERFRIPMSPHRYQARGIEAGGPQARRVEAIGRAAPQRPLPLVPALRQPKPMGGEPIGGAILPIRRDQLMHRAERKPALGQRLIQLGQAQGEGPPLAAPAPLQPADADAKPGKLGRTRFSRARDGRHSGRVVRHGPARSRKMFLVCSILKQEGASKSSPCPLMSLAVLSPCAPSRRRQGSPPPISPRSRRERSPVRSRPWRPWPALSTWRSRR